MANPSEKDRITTDERLHDLIAEYHDRVDQGETLEPAAFVSEHPDLETELSRYFDNVATLESLAGPTASQIQNDPTATVIAGETHDGAFNETMIENSRSGNAVRISNDAPLTQFGRYRITKELGRGAMGAVYLAHDQQLDREIALKIPKFDSEMNADLLERFYREARAAAALQHPGICPVFDVGELDGQHYITMGFIKGRPLRDFTKSSKRQEGKQVARVIRKIAMAMAEAHEHNVTHRDLKPANIMINQKNEPVVMDFGLARRSAEGEEQLTHTGTVIGTPAYMSPEQVDGDNEHVGPHSDIYSLGVIFYEMLAGQLPFQGNLMSILRQIATDDPRPPVELHSDTDLTLQALCLRMLAKKPEDRPASMEQVAQELSDWLQGRHAPTDESGLLETSRVPGQQPAADSALQATVPATVPGRAQTQPVAEEFPDAVDMSVTTQHPRTGNRQSGPPKNQKRLLLGGLGGATIVLAGIVFFLSLGGKYDVQITLDDPSMSLKVDGETVVIEGGDAPIRLSAGEHTLHVEMNGFGTDTGNFTVTKDGKTAVHVARLDQQKKLKIHVGGKPDIPPGTVANATKQPAASPDGNVPVATGSTGPPPPAVAPFDAATAQQHQQAWAKYLGEPVERDITLPGGEKLTMVLIPPGEFLMGSMEDEQNNALEEAKAADDQWAFARIPSEGPQHRMRITRPFYLGKYEVTQAQWQSVMGSTPSQFKDNPSHPVEQVSWDEIQPFLAKLNESGSADRMKFALPSEAQWEYACRSGTTTSYYGGVGENESREYFWFDGNSGGKTHPVGELKPNGFGLYDMHGNVWEWCADWYASDYYAKSPADDPMGPSAGLQRVFRGGSWNRHSGLCRSAHRHGNSPVNRYSDLGFRLAISIDDANLKTKSTVTAPPAIRNTPLPAVAPFDEAQAKAHQEAWAKYLDIPVEYENSIGMKFRLIPPGEFLMGSTPEEIEAALKKMTVADEAWREWINSEGPQHKVILTQPVYVGVTEVTQSQYEQVTGKNPSHFSATGAGKEAVANLETGNHPVEMVSWNDAAEFCAKLSQQEKLKPFYFRSGETVTPLDGTGYRLPTEAEWESACRAGTTARFWSGDEDQDLLQAGWFGGNLSGRRTHAAGELKANPFGLSDVHGNVWEWVQDSWDPAFYGKFKKNGVIDPSSSFSVDSQRMLRGGGWSRDQFACRSSARRPSTVPAIRDVGFRVALAVDAVKRSLAQKQVIVPATRTAERRTRTPASAIAPFDADQAKAHQQAWADYLGVSVETTNSIGMKLVVIPPGTFQMGEGRNGAGGNIVDVTLTKPFRIGIHEVTQAQWKSVMNTEPWKEQQDAHEGETVAATNISWHAANAFCQKLTEQERSAGRLSDNWQYRLPTEAQWEFACRAGTTTPFSFGDDPSQLGNYGWYLDNAKNAGADHPHPVGQKKPNAWGLFDVHGNVWECCFDFFYGNYAGGTDPMGPSNGDRRAKRGGAWLTNTGYCWSATRLGLPPSYQDSSVGLRVALVSVDEVPAQKVGSSIPMPLDETRPAPTPLLTSADWEWTSPERLNTGANSTSQETTPELSDDALTLLFASDRPGGQGDLDLWIATRPSLEEPFGEPQNLGPNINSPGKELGPCLMTGGQELWFSRDASLWVSKRTTANEPFGQAQQVSSAVNSERTMNPTISPDGRTIVVESIRKGGLGRWDLWTATRSTSDDVFSKPTNLGVPYNTESGNEGGA